MVDHARTPLDFLVLGHSPEGATGWPHPVTIGVYPRSETTLLNFSMGPHIANVGGQIRLSTVIIDGELNESFAEEFDACEARWLVPYLTQLAAGTEISSQDLANAYQTRFGHRPRTELSADNTY